MPTLILTLTPVTSLTRLTKSNVILEVALPVIITRFLHNLENLITIIILRDGINHVNPELHTAVGVVGAGVRDPADTVVTVSQQLDPETVMLVSELVKPDIHKSQ